MSERGNNRTGIFHTINGERREIVVEMLDPAQAEIYRSWTPVQRMQAAADQCRFMRQMIKGHLKSLHPEWSPEELERAVAQRILGHAV